MTGSAEVQPGTLKAAEVLIWPLALPLASLAPFPAGLAAPPLPLTDLFPIARCHPPSTEAPV